MASFRRGYSLKKAYLKDNKVIKMLLEDTIIGFYAFNMSQQIPELEYFYLKPKFIGQGYGRKLWNNTIEFCENNKIKAFIFVAGPEVKVYYLKMGAEVTETLTS